MRRVCRAAVLVCLASACASSVADPPPQAAALSQRLDMLTYDARVTDEGLDRLALSFPFEIESEVEGTVRLGAVEYQLSIDGEPSVHGAVAMTESGPGVGTLGAQFAAVAKLPTSRDAFARRTQALLSYTLDARIEVQIAKGVEVFEAQWSGEVFAPKRPTLSVHAQAARYTRELDLTITLTLSNPNAFSLELDSVPYTFTVEGETVLEGVLAQQTRFAPNSEMKFDFQQRLDTCTFPELVKALENAEGFDYATKARILMGELELPVEHAGRVDFPR
ncbi:MAG: LEA type 2 family protein [Myxococcota bacterium]